MRLNSKRGAGEAVSTLILFIAVMTVTITLVIAFKNYVFDTQQSFNTQNEITSNKLRTSISIINIYYNTTSNISYTYVKNIGETKLRPELFDIFIDEVYREDFLHSYASNLSQNITLFQPQDTLAIIVPVDLPSGSYDVKIVTEHGIGDEDSFNV